MLVPPVSCLHRSSRLPIYAFIKELLRLTPTSSSFRMSVASCVDSIARMMFSLTPCRLSWMSCSGSSSKSAGPVMNDGDDCLLFEARLDEFDDVIRW